jgi:hypothetical protein
MAASAGIPARAATHLHRSACNDPTAYEIGWDFARHRLTPPVAHLQAESPVHLGWRTGRAAFGPRTLPATPRVRQWLTLRLQAWVQGVVFEDVQVTPHHLQQLDASHCPVTREPLTRATGSGSELTIRRMNVKAACAAGNLAALSAQASAAQGQRTAVEAMALSQQLAQAEGDSPRQVDGLDSDQWARLGVLMSFATPLPHATAAQLPLLVLPPNRLRVLNAVQALQVMLTLQFVHAGYARRLVALAALMPNSEVRQAFQVFMHTLLARRMDAGMALDAPAMRRAMEDTWRDPLVNRRWQRLAMRLTAAQCEQLLQRSAQRSLSGKASQWITLDQATEGWSLATEGYVQLPAATPPQLDGGVLTEMPGKARSFGSQKLASCETFTTLAAFQ